MTSVPLLATLGRGAKGDVTGLNMPRRTHPGLAVLEMISVVKPLNVSWAYSGASSRRPS